VEGTNGVKETGSGGDKGSIGDKGIEGTRGEWREEWEWRGEGGLQGHYKPQKQAILYYQESEKDTTPLGKNNDVCQKLS